MMNSRLHPSQQQVAPPPHHLQAPPPPPSSTQVPVSKTMQQLASVNEQTWLSIGDIAEMMFDYDKALNCYESALRHNPYSISALNKITAMNTKRAKEQPQLVERTIEYFKQMIAVQENNGEIWANLGHAYLEIDNLQEAYQAYQQALYHLNNPKDPKLWYGIGILYDRYGSLDHAEEAFSAAMKMDPQFEKSSEVYFRLGIIYKQQKKYDFSLQCFQYIAHNPPQPLNEFDVWFQTGLVYEQMKEYQSAKEAYEHVLDRNPDHAQVLQQLGWLYLQRDATFHNQQYATQLLNKSIKADGNDAQSWYLLGRCYMAEQNYNKAYEAYQQAVYRDARNPVYWCSIGILYYQIGQQTDALDAYSKAIRSDPNISEIWYNLGVLYETSNNQLQDALDAYTRAAEFAPANPRIKERIDLTRNPNKRTANTPPPVPQDIVNPSLYNNINNTTNTGGSGFDKYKEELEKRKLSEQRSRHNTPSTTTAAERDLPLMNNAPPQHHSPSIRNHPHTLQVRDAKVEEPKSPQPSSFEHKNAIKREDEEMTDATVKTSPPQAKPAIKSENHHHNNEDTEMD